ncbi:4439_t:CDS:2, partial [Cetraspora pellucida]
SNYTAKALEFYFDNFIISDVERIIMKYPKLLFLQNDDNKSEFVIPKRQKKGEARYFEPILLDPQNHINSSDAGDSFVGALISGLTLHSDSNIDKIIDIVQQVAVMTLQSYNS